MAKLLQKLAKISETLSKTAFLPFRRFGGLTKRFGWTISANFNRSFGRNFSFGHTLFIIYHWNLNSDQISKLYWMRFHENSSYDNSSVSRKQLVHAQAHVLYSSIHYFFVSAFRWNIAFDQGQKVLILYATLR